MIADEPHLPYERPPLSKAVLAGEAGIDTVRLLAPHDFAALNVEAWQPDRAVSIDRAAQRVHTESGRSVEYDRLVIATGGAARRLPAALAATSHLAYLRTLDDAVALGTRLRASQRVLVVGGGWIGLEVAASARKLGVEASVIEGAPRLCARSVPPVVSRFLLELHRANGVDVHLDASLVSLTDHGDAAAQVRATLVDGTTLDADFAIAGVGLEPHTAFARAAGLAVEDGVVVDVFGATSDPRVFACDWSRGRMRRTRRLPPRRRCSANGCRTRTSPGSGRTSTT
jgi:3-phenylpropionate/trans-cinnamate dioxygenase ferredoxin reductase subunit